MRFSISWLILALFTFTLFSLAPFEPAYAEPVPTPVAAPNSFDGHKLYAAAFAALRDNHKTLPDPATRAKWCAEWEHAYDHDQTLDTPEGADRAVLTMIHSLGQRFDFYLDPTETRAELAEETSANVVHVKDLGNGIAYIKLDTFDSDNCDEEMAQALKQTADSKALILDLRHNRGGWVFKAVSIAQQFLSEGTVLLRRDRNGDTMEELRISVGYDYVMRDELTAEGRSFNRFSRTPALVAPDKPIIVLVDDRTASSAEILAAALQFNHRATVVGVTSFGKGVGQSPIDLPYGRRLHVTSFEFYPAGQSIDWVGVIPDIQVVQKAHHSPDRQLAAAIRESKKQIKKQAALQEERRRTKQKNVDEFQQRQKKLR